MMQTKLSKAHRIIAHLDMDCFYCQVEHKRLNIPQDQPLGVLQWNTLVAVNYAARASNVKRGDSVSDAMNKCPSINIVHVETLTTKNEDVKDTALEKITLQRYREASSQIMSIISSNCKRVERASVDEAYLDLTEEVTYAVRNLAETTEPDAKKQEIQNEFVLPTPTSKDGNFNHPYVTKLHFKEFDDAETLQIIGATHDGKMVNPITATTEELCLLIGSLCVYRIRQQIFENLSYTVSGGISTNKLLSKLASSSFKPNKQVIVLPQNANHLLKELSVRKLRGLGGKLGAKLQSCFPNVQTAVDLQEYDLSALHKHFDAGASIFLWKICRAIDEEPVVPNLKVKSMLASKRFPAVTDTAVLNKWLYVLAEELQSRIWEGYEKFSRKPKTLSTVADAFK